MRSSGRGLWGRFFVVLGHFGYENCELLKARRSAESAVTSKTIEVTCRGLLVNSLGALAYFVGLGLGT